MTERPEKFGRFRVTSELGRGAMGVVYCAEDPSLGRTVAIKTIALTGSPQERDIHEARFLQEARAAGGIGHPAIITIYDVGREGDVAFIAMELLEGNELRDLIRWGTIAPPQAVAIAASVADGLAYAHERGVVHRDVKPGNIMVLKDGRVKVMDFGIARLGENAVKTQTGTLLGSPQYMSPEQIAGGQVDSRADIFSLGVVLYEMLTGAKPFAGEDVTQLLFSIANMAAKPPRHLQPSLPPVIDYIIARALKKNPDERYQTAAELASDLRSCAAEVAEAEITARAKPDDGTRTSPNAPPAPHDMPTQSSRPLPLSEEQVALRPSPRFDSVEGIARLAVFPLDASETKSRAGWTVPSAKVKRRRARQLAPLLGIWLVAVLAAIAIVLF
ncbi:Serine/threonine-protein kinase PknD [Usitatibacter rugosus]|uniref:non-specific serine/threonine protein kinase n=1 Tax=Usitatibacter rugosus TaxID=2732067 RepID=A0A6M4GQX8_9PROT|nr:serine/threonine-protein kinase [Usitatibacter rugosus]QJR09476.1 Serine/threonine-protein kinase PknD [Usitatibacter rugosus]